MPIPCYCQLNINANDINFALKIEKIIEKAKKAVEKNDSNKLIDLMFEAKREIETYSGTIIDLDHQIDTVESEIKKSGTKIPKKEFKELRKFLKKKEKKLQHKAQYLETCLLNPEMTYNLEDEELLFAARHGNDDKGDTEIVIPIRLTVGVTIALIGLFIIVVPVIPPPIKPWGKDLVLFGTGMAGEACASLHDERQKK